MKTNKALKKLTKIEALMVDLTARYKVDANHLPKKLREAQAAVARAKDAVAAQASIEAKKESVAKTSPRKKTVNGAVQAPVLATSSRASVAHT